MTDFQLDDDLELRMAAGDFAVEESTLQESQCLCLAAPGDYWFEPILGLNMSRFVGAPMNDDVLNELRRELEVQHEIDGLKISNVRFGKTLSDTKMDVERP